MHIICKTKLNLVFHRNYSNELIKDNIYNSALLWPFITTFILIRKSVNSTITCCTSKLKLMFKPSGVFSDPITYRLQCGFPPHVEIKLMEGRRIAISGLPQYPLALF